MDLAEHLDAMPVLREAQGLQVGFSGGLDSSVLLSVATDWGRVKAIPVKALHIHHGLQAGADHFAEHCRTQAQALGVSFECRRVQVADLGLGYEGNARHARMAAFADSLQPGQVLLLGHHHQDQLETILMRLLRGAGLPALAGMPAIRPLAAGYLARPFLQVARDHLRACASVKKLNWVEDPDNQSLQPGRNRIRHLLLPALAEHWPDHDAALDTLAGRMKDAVTLLSEVAAEDLQSMLSDTTPPSLDLPALRALSSARRKNLLHAWLADRGFWRFTEAHYRDLNRQITTTDKAFHFTWSEGAFAAAGKRLWLLSGELPAKAPCQSWRPDEGAYQCHFGTLSAIAVQDGGLKAHLPLQIRYRVSCAHIRLGGMRRSLKKICQRYGVPVWARAWLPLVFSGDRLAAVADLCIADDAVADQGETGWRLCWRGTSDYTRLPPKVTEN